jgi:hypothetical protein
LAEIANEAPIAVRGLDLDAELGAAVALDGMGSHDTERDPVSNDGLRHSADSFFDRIGWRVRSGGHRPPRSDSSGTAAAPGFFVHPDGRRTGPCGGLLRGHGGVAPGIAHDEDPMRFTTVRCHAPDRARVPGARRAALARRMSSELRK